jgi:hypothetical protein
LERLVYAEHPEWRRNKTTAKRVREIVHERKEALYDAAAHAAFTIRGIAFPGAGNNRPLEVEGSLVDAAEAGQ